MAEWFKDWFNTNYYHLLYRNRDFKEARAFIRNLVKEINLSKDAKVIDLACGKGRHAKMLNEHGFNVLGLDLSVESIKAASELENSSLRFQVHDMREPFPEKGFDAVFNLFTSLGYFEDEKDNCKVLKAVASNLKPGGIFVIDFMNVNKVVKDLVPAESKDIEGVRYNITRSIDNGFINKHIEVIDNGCRMNFEEKVQAITDNTFIDWLEQEGFEVLKTFGNYELEPYDRLNSNRLIILAGLK